MLFRSMSDTLKEDANIFVDVGQHQIWVAQSYDVKNNQQMFFSGGHGAMGFALPAGIGVFPKQKDIKKQPMFTCLQTKEYCY